MMYTYQVALKWRDISQFAELHSFLQENIYHFEYTYPQTSAPTVHSHTPGRSHRALTDWCRRPP